MAWSPLLTDIYNMDGERLVECVAALYRLLIAREQLAPCGDIEREIHIGREGYQQCDGYHDCGDDYLRALVLCGGTAFSLICHISSDQVSSSAGASDRAHFSIHCCLVISTWRGLLPSNGPMMPLLSSSSMSLAARA